MISDCPWALARANRYNGIPDTIISDFLEPVGTPDQFAIIEMDTMGSRNHSRDSPGTYGIRYKNTHNGSIYIPDHDMF